MKVLVPEAHTIGSLACIRSLGQADHHVVAMSGRSEAIGFGSRYCSAKVAAPTSVQNAEEYASDLRRIVDHYQIDFLIPSEGTIAALSDHFADFSAILPVGPDLQQLPRFMSKWNLFKLFMESQDDVFSSNLPPTLLLHGEGNIVAFINDVQAPYYAKVDARPYHMLPGRVFEYADPATALANVPDVLRQYGRVVLQGHVPGRGVGVFALRWRGKIRAILMHRRLHEVPHTGGVSSYRETWWHDAIAADALRRLEYMNWWGVGMLEYRWDETSDRFWLMEFNARFWGSLHLALFAGVDFPKLLVEEWSGITGQQVVARPGVRARLTYPKEVEYVWSVLKDSRLTWQTKLSAVAEFLALSVNPNVHSDLWFPGDRRVYLHGLLATIRQVLLTPAG